MTDRMINQRVIGGLECCLSASLGETICPTCTYRYDENGVETGDCEINLLKDAIALLKAQESRVMGLNELAFYDSGLYVETHNGCPEGLTDELWPALVHLYCVSQKGECGYVSFINWNADTYDFEAKDYNVRFRCWTSCPTDEQREVTPWN